jgi:hypothetical protein
MFTAWKSFAWSEDCWRTAMSSKRKSAKANAARRILIAGSLLVSAAATPALAQSVVLGWHDSGYGHGYNDGYRSGYDLQRQIDRVERQIQRAGEVDRITPYQERNLLRRLVHVERLFMRYRVNGLSPWERRDITERLHVLQREIWSGNRWERDRWSRDPYEWNRGGGDYRWQPYDDDDDDDDDHDDD